MLVLKNFLHPSTHTVRINSKNWPTNVPKNFVESLVIKKKCMLAQRLNNTFSIALFSIFEYTVLSQLIDNFSEVKTFLDNTR